MWDVLPKDAQKMSTDAFVEDFVKKAMDCYMAKKVLCLQNIRVKVDEGYENNVSFYSLYMGWKNKYL